MDVSKLSPAPWSAKECGDGWLVEARGWVIGYETESGNGSGVLTKTEAAFIALARNAFAVMMERGWTARKLVFPLDDILGCVHREGWQVVCSPEGFEEIAGRRMRRPLLGDLDELLCPDPFTALVEADKWMRDQEAQSSASPT